MEYSKIIAVTGLPGLFELVSSKSDGGIVRSLDDKSTRFVSSRVHQFSHLESIEVYTTRHNVNLVEVLTAMQGSKEKLPDEKDSAGLKSYFEKVYPELDFDRVYTSDLKKMVKWYAVLAKNEVEIKLSEAVAEEEAIPEIEEEKTDKKSTKAVVKTADAEEKKTAKKTTPKASEEKPPAGKKTSEKKVTEAEKPAAKKSAEKEKKPAEEKAVAKKSAKPAAEKKPAAKKK